MEFEGLSDTIARQVTEVWNAPIPFVVAVALVALLIWRAMEWRYGGAIDRLRGDVTYLEKALPNPAPKSAQKDSSGGKNAPAPRRASTSRAERGREFLPPAVTPQFISRMREDLTDLQTTKIMAGYIGKWMEVDGTVAHIKPVHGGIVMIQIETDNDGSLRGKIDALVSVFFDHAPSEFDRLSRGDAVRVIGKLQSIDGLGLTLEHGELLV